MRRLWGSVERRSIACKVSDRERERVHLGHVVRVVGVAKLNVKRVVGGGMGGWGGNFENICLKTAQKRVVHFSIG